MDSRSDQSQEDAGSKEPIQSKVIPKQETLPPWGMYTVLVSLFTGYILLPLIVSNVITLINPFLDKSAELLVQQIATMMTWGIIFIVLHLSYGKLPQYIGLRRPTNMRYFLWETIRLLGLSALVIMALAQFWNITQSLKPEWFTNLQEPYAHASRSELTVLFIFAVVFAPIVEELIFRGLVQSTFHKLTTPARSILYTSIVFLLLHGSYFENIKALTTVFALGICFGIWRERTQSILPGMIVHWLNNLAASILLFYK